MHLMTAQHPPRSHRSPDYVDEAFALRIANQPSDRLSGAAMARPPFVYTNLYIVLYKFSRILAPFPVIYSASMFPLPIP